MKNKYIKSITAIALVSILLLQGLWLYNTYTLLESEFQNNFDKRFLNAVEKEGYHRLADPTNKEKFNRKIVEGLQPDNDPYTNVKAAQDFLYKENIPMSLERVDSILNANLREANLTIENYSLSVTDSLGNRTACIQHGEIEKSTHQETIQLRTVDPEYITIAISSPYRAIFGQMLSLLIGSLLLAIVVIYCIVFQIQIIRQQDKIAEIRRDFTHAMLHEMKNPVTSILMGINTLKGGKLDTNVPMKEQYYTVIHNESERISALTNKILTIAQFEEGKIGLSKQLIRLAELLNELTEKYRLISAKEVRFQIELNEVDYIYADKEYILEAFSNLIDNAIKYSKGEKVDITITAWKKNHAVQIKFRDEGIGIATKDQKKIFEKFERASSVRKNQKASGFGLGLNYVYQTLSTHGGKIEVHSELGKYSEFTIQLPSHDKITID
jgi:two-component system phosphate regulon sensor histidine kinase PhoR